MAGNVELRSGWDNLVDRIMIGPEILQEMEQMVKKVKHNLEVAQDRQKNYANQKIQHKEFNFGGHVYLKVQEKIISL
jgi:hypothetical protein